MATELAFGRQASAERGRRDPVSIVPRAMCFDLLSALLDSWSVWDRVAAQLGGGELGRSWRRKYLFLTSTAGAYRPYLAVVSEAAEAVGLPAQAATLLERAWEGLRPWPDVGPALAGSKVPVAVVTNCSLALGRRAAACVPHHFPVMVTAEEAAAYKPDPAPTGSPASALAAARRRWRTWRARPSTRRARGRRGSGSPG